jgi:DNA-directed RNA polymerase subunit M/transcription elongation factor TFIIS
MRVHQITCPKCGSGLKSKAGIPVGQIVPCPKCKTRFPVAAPDEPDIVDDADLVNDAEVVEDFEAEEAAPKKKGPPPVPAKKPAARRRDDDDETEEEESLPRKKARRRPADDDEEPVRRKKKRRGDEEEEEGLYLRLKHNVWVRVITLVVLLGILGVVAFLYYELKIKQPAETTNSSGTPSGQADDGR